MSVRSRFSGHVVIQTLFALGALALILSFAYAALRGPFGVTRMLAAEEREIVLKQDLALLVTERERLENLTMRLSDQYLDLDLLDEQARETLGLIRPDEIIIR
ncbi:cell division protein FtsB [Rubricella aquisinus]|uniref:Cell division protein FtsB n=1 Tax=Rubricella aquisinus TaxID=2028108 RepID=A0A840WSB0_9RHOB|nr:septum formation initiator family protein [Rubricella aquisinus]MBB5516552.1 cell division protein FtsB [Rubricella aquisinus]